MVIRELLVKLGVITDTKKVTEFDQAVEGVREQLEGVVRVGKQVITAVAGIGAAAAAMAVATARSAEAADRQAKALQLGVEAAQEYTAVFESVGADAADVGDVFNTLADRSQDALDGMQSFIDDFSLLGIAVEDLRGKQPEQLFLDFADAVADTEDVVKRNAAVVRLLGDDVGNRLLPVLMQGSAGIAAMREEARRLGLVMSEEDVKAAKEAALQFRAFDRVMTGLRNQIGLAVIPTMVKLVARLQDFVARNRALAREKIEGIMERFGGAAEKAEGALVSINAFVKDNLAGWGNVLRRAQTALALFAGAKAWSVLSSAIVALKVGVATVAATLGVSFSSAIAIVAGVAAVVFALGVAIDDVMTYLRGGESVLGTFLEQTQSGRMLVEALTLAMTQAGVIIEQLGPVFDFFLQRMDLLVLAGELLGKVFVEVVAFGFNAVVRQITAFVKFVAQAYELLNSIIALVKGEGGFGDVFREAMETVGSTVLALPGIGALTAGGPSSPIGNTFGRPRRPQVTPAGGGGGSRSPAVVNNVTVQGNTTNLNSEVTPSQLEEMGRRNDREQSRALLAFAGAPS